MWARSLVITHRDDPLGGSLLEQRPGDLLDHPRLGPLAHPDQHGPVADRLHVAALQGRPAEVLDVEALVVAELGGYQNSKSASANIGWYR